MIYKESELENGNYLECGGRCLFYRFFRNSREAMFVTSREGKFIDVNRSMENLLGYTQEELLGMNVADLYESGDDRKTYARIIETEGLVHDYGVPLLGKEGKIIFCLIDAIVWMEDGKINGYHGIIRTKNEVVDAFKIYFNKLKTEKEKLKEARKNLVSDTAVLMRHMSDDMIQYMQKTGKNPLETSKRRASVLCVKIRKSTSMAEQLPPDIFADFLNEFLTDIMDLVYGNSGSVAKVTGDGLLATFGCPLPAGDDTFNAVQTALQIREYLQTYNDVRPEFLTEPLAVGMGISTGIIFSGVIGSVRRQEYTVLGDPVNVADRLHLLTKKCEEDILIDQETQKEIQTRISCGQNYTAKMKGRKASIEVYGLTNETES